MFDFLQQYFSEFSSQSWTVLGLWPVISAALTSPYLIYVLATRQVLRWGRVLLIFAFLTYMVGISAGLTVWPFPEDPASFCQLHNVQPNFDFWYFITDFIHHPQSSILQLLGNVIVFLPMGWFARKLFRWGLFRTVIVGVGFTLLAEWAQLNAVFGLLPCNYRTFDVDDIALNAIGLVLGWLIALI